MKKNIVLISAILLLLSHNTFASDAGTEKINKSMQNILEDLTLIVPENTSLLNTTADAYIGKLFPAFPPHFSAGVSLSGTLIDTSFIIDGVQTIFDQIKSCLEEMDGTCSFDFSLPSKLPLPTAALRLRVGGIVLPFDAGLFFVTTIPGVFDSLSFNDFSGGISYTTFGADLRYAVLEGNLILPQVSITAGYIYQKQSIDFSASKSISFSGESQAKGKLSTAVDLDLDTNTLYLGAQISKQIFITTPYIGVRAFLTQANQYYDWNFTTIVNETKNNEASKKGSKKTNVDFDFSNIQPQIYLGATLHVALFELSLSGAWNPLTNYLSCGFQTNFKM